MQLARLNRAEMCALIVETLASFGIEVVLVGDSCICIFGILGISSIGSFDGRGVEINRICNG